ncbi:MAG TPA: hypothetical protein VL574_02655 [Stellaceae bacterium]|nr:hypothetical protein [Stellaceae bacterium]
MLAGLAGPLILSPALADNAPTAKKPAKPAAAKPVKRRVPSQALECAAFTIHGITVPGPDGVQEAGLYKASFGRLDLQARIRGGKAVNYFLTLDGHAMPPLTQLPPRLLRPCLDVKGTALRLSEQHQPCPGNRFQILLTRAGEGAPQYVLLYRLAGSKPTVRSWHFCRGAMLAPDAAPVPAQ